MAVPAKNVSNLSPGLTDLLNSLLHAKPKTPGSTRGSPGRDLGLGASVAMLNERYVPQALGKAGANLATPTEQQRADYYKTIARSTRADPGGRAYQLTSRKNEFKGNERAGQKFRTFVKRDDSGDIYRYHQYNTPGGKRKVVRVGGPVNRKLT